MVIPAAGARFELQFLVGAASLAYLATRKPGRPLARGKAKVVALLCSALVIFAASQVLIILGHYPALPVDLATQAVASPLGFAAVAAYPYARPSWAGENLAGYENLATLKLPTLDSALFCWPLFAAFYVSMVTTRLDLMLLIFVLVYALVFTAIRFVTRQVRSTGAGAKGLVAD